MAKRGIDTPAKDDPNRKKPRQKGPEGEGSEDVNVAESSKAKPAPLQTAVQSTTAHAASKKSPPVAPVAQSLPAVAAAAVSVASNPKSTPASSGRMGLLDMLRSSVSVGGASKTAKVEDKKQMGVTTNSDAKAKDDASAKTPEVKTVVKKEPALKEIELQNKRSVWGLGLVAALGILNIASISHLVSEQSLHNVAQMKCRVENEKLSDDLSKNNGVISVLKSGLDAAQNQIKFIEQAQESKRKALKELREQRKGVGILSEDEQKKWHDRKTFLREKRDQLLDDFNLWLAKLDEVDGME
jgi:flagellar biosynthesis chaperone FliJ